MSSRRPATLSFSLDRLAEHGGRSGPHRDGWGVAFYDGRDVRLFREPEPASDSALVRFLEDHSPCTTLAVSHIRRATRGRPIVANTQPFVRELGGRMHVFAHNGDLAHASEDFRPARFLPVGETDSELAFCVLLERVSALWDRSRKVPALNERLRVVATFARDVRQYGPANFLYADGDTLFAHGHRRHHADETLRPPGLCLLRRPCGQPIKGAGITVTSPEQEVVLLASVPLTDEGWRPLAEGELVAVADGRVVLRESP